jgi:hypothetical protein
MDPPTPDPPAHFTDITKFPAVVGVMVREPAVGNGPEKMGSPTASQDVALVEDQVSVTDCPNGIELALAVRVTLTGGGGSATATVRVMGGAVAVCPLLAQLSCSV